MTTGLPGWCGNESLVGKADAALRKLHEKSPELSRVLADMPVEAALSAFARYDVHAGYNQLGLDLSKLCSGLIGRYGEPLTLRYGLAMLATLIGEHDRRWRESALDAQLEPCFIDSFHRILTAVARGGARSLMPDTDAFAKELAICLYRLIPAGGQLIDPGCAVPRRLVARRPTLETLAAARYMIFNAGGFAPFAAFHSNLFQRHWFTPSGWEYSFQCMPAVFRSFPALKGLTGSSWFFDPALRDISPELNFVREIPRRWGAVFVPVKPENSATADALLLSPKRRELFEAGKYIPQIHAFLVSKRDILGHAAAGS
jgi:hypothetical protein